MIAGSLLSVDLSSVRAESAGDPAGAAPEERLPTLVDAAEAHAGDVLELRSDGLLVLFTGGGHERSACAAAVELRRALAAVAGADPELQAGIHSGDCSFSLVVAGHRELIAAGPAASETLRLVRAARPGEIVVGPATAAALDGSCLGPDRDGGRVLATAPAVGAPTRAAAVPDADSTGFVPPALRARLQAGSYESEQRRVTVAFLAFSGSDTLHAREGPLGAQRAYQALADAVGAAAARFGVAWLGSSVAVDGGRLLLVAGLPPTTTADEEAMLLALRAILASESPLPLRAGVDSGRVVTGDLGSASRRTFALIGDAVTVAARLAASAEPGELLATEAVLERSRARYESRPRPVLVRGRARPVTAVSVGAARAAGAEEELLPLVGRTLELAELDAALAAARRRTSRLVEIAGEPGIGKSRLVAELQARAAGFTQLVARSTRTRWARRSRRSGRCSASSPGSPTTRLRTRPGAG